MALAVPLYFPRHSGGWGATYGDEDAQVRRQVPGRSQLPLSVTVYVPITFGMTLHRGRVRTQPWRIPC
jgi:hypothetical protein